MLRFINNQTKRKILYLLTLDNKYKPNRDLKDLSNCYCTIAKNKGY